MKSKTIWFRSDLGYGFISAEDNQSYFVHQQNIEAPGYRQLVRDQEVEFEPSQNDRGPYAMSIKPGPLPEEKPRSFRDTMVTKGVGNHGQSG